MPGLKPQGAGVTFGNFETFVYTIARLFREPLSYATAEEVTTGTVESAFVA